MRLYVRTSGGWGVVGRDLGFCKGRNEMVRANIAFVGALIATLGGLAAPMAVAQDHTITYFDQLRITVDARARAEGYVRVRLLPKNGTPREGTFDVHRRMSENDIAKGITMALESVVGPEYTVDRTAGEHVKVRKATKDAPDFGVEIAFTVPGFSIQFDN